MPATDYLNLDLLRMAPLNTQYFPYLIVPHFLQPLSLPGIHQDYPLVQGPGSYPVDILKYGKHFQGLLDALQGPELRSIIAEKFAMSLDKNPTLITVRGRAQLKDGSIHRDTKSKLITVLLYLNPSWEEKGGCLRLLRNAYNLEDVIEEIPPLEGTLLVFKVSPNSWHGHKPFQGERRVLQLNYVTDEMVVKKELARHRFTAKIKKIKKLFGIDHASADY